jgi:hypothetical protein
MTEVERQLAHSTRAALGETAQAARNRARRTAARDARTDQNHRRPASSTRESTDVSAPTARSSRDAGGDWPLPRARSTCKLVPPGRGVRLEQDSRAGCSAQPRAIGRVRVAGTSRAIRLTAPFRPTQQRAGAPGGAPALLVCREAGVSPGAPGRRPTRAPHPSVRHDRFTDTGSGLWGLCDRVEALGGRLTLTSPAGSGTTVRAVRAGRGRAPAVISRRSSSMNAAASRSSRTDRVR